jgi:hypothetical protein
LVGFALTYTSTDFVAYVFSPDVVAHSSPRIQPPTSEILLAIGGELRAIAFGEKFGQMHRANFVARQI